MSPVEISPVVLQGLASVLALLAAALALAAINRHRLLCEARRSEQRFRDLCNNISEGVFRSTLDGHMISANPALVKLNGFASEEEMLHEVNDIAGQWYVDPNRRAEIHNRLLVDGRVENLVSEVYRYKTRERIWIEENTRLVRDEGGRPLYYEGTVREVTDRVRKDELQERYDRAASVVFGCLYQLRVTPDGKATFTYLSEGVSRIYGLTPQEAMADASLMGALVLPEDAEHLRQSFADATREMRPRQDEYRIRTVDGTEKWIYGHSVPEREADGSILWHGYFVDVTAKKQAEARVYDLAYRDSLTGLPNRTALMEGAAAALVAGRVAQRWSALIYVDLDQFKVLNDTKGHQFGDRLLTAVAERLKPVVGDDGLVARLGGDEFVVMVRDIGRSHTSAEVQARRIAECLQTAMRDPFVLDGFPCHISTTIGIALASGADIGVDELLRRADVALFEAKARGRGQIALFAPPMQQELEEQLALTMELRDALEGGLLTLAYQPQVDNAGVCFGVEALLRWNHPERGAISPVQFIPLAERAGLGGQIDAFVLSSACATLRRWRDMPALRHLHLSVNIGSQRLDRGLVTLVSEAARAHAVDATRLTIEITERVMLDNAQEVDFALAALKNLGVRIALDDFGTGYSSLSHLKRLPIDTLKIDRSFVDDIETDTNDRVIVQTILNIARNLGVAAIAEGVENEMQALLLRRFGCHAYQGFLYGRPVTCAEFEAAAIAADIQPVERVAPQPLRAV